MSKLDVIKENIQFEQLVRESNSNIVLKDEYLIPDTHPDVEEILCIECRPTITNKEIIGEKVVVEGKVDYIVLYLAREDELVVNSVEYTQKFTSNIDLNSDEHKIICEVEGKIEHIEAMIMNERKIAIQGILTIDGQIYKNKQVEFVKEIESNNDVEILKKTEMINSVNATKEVNMNGKSIIRVGMDKPQIEKILRCNLMLHKKEIKVVDDKMYLGCYCKINILYKSSESKEIICLDDDIYLSKEEEIEGITLDMMPEVNFDILDNEVLLEEDDLGEVRIINAEFNVKACIKIFSTENVETIKDAYSPKFLLGLRKEECEIGMIQGINSTETVVKDGIQLKEDDLKPEQILSTNAIIIVTDKEVKKDRVEVEGIVKVDVLYKTKEEEKYLSNVKGEIPFKSVIDISGAEEGMKSTVKAAIENLEAFLEGNSISMKVTLGLNTKVLYEVNKELISDIVEEEGEIPDNKSSITIYVVGEEDTLWSLAKKFNTTIEDLIKINEIDDPECIDVGQKLIIPGRAKF